MSEKPKIEVGQVWIDKKGNEVRIVATDAMVKADEGSYPVVGLMRHNESENVNTYTADGVFYVGSRNGENDLVRLKPDVREVKCSIELDAFGNALRACWPSQHGGAKAHGTVIGTLTYEVLR